MSFRNIAIICLFVLNSACQSHDTPATSLALTAEGGRLYDKWWAELKLAKPMSTHPSYPASGNKKGASTWRCKECHGWDYKGAEGAYATGSHYTGIKGIQRLSGANQASILAILKDSTHRYGDVMTDAALERIADFVSTGQVDNSRYIDPKTTQAKGDADKGKPIFNQWCQACHGNQGNKINFKDQQHPEYVGTVAFENPWEALHKFRHGQPSGFVGGAPMPHMNDKLSQQQQADLLRYLQTLPVK